MITIIDEREILKALERAVKAIEADPKNYKKNIAELTKIEQENVLYALSYKLLKINKVMN